MESCLATHTDGNTETSIPATHTVVIQTLDFVINGFLVASFAP
jgi:hypothetical protein